ncbi:MAG: AGE family epimerase/isomerase, partial [Clostridia bacterium]|nr:AGE family epimerase/isomerase [Clostridia bacterium]
MILTNVLCELYRASVRFAPEKVPGILERIRKCHREVFEVFLGGDGLIREFRHAKPSREDNLFVEHINPGHTLEDMWFQSEAADLWPESPFEKTIPEVVLRTLEKGWDKEYGGLLHFTPVDGLQTAYRPLSAAEEPQMKLMLDDWGSKLWWVHSEALYTTLLMYFRTGREEYLDWNRTIRSYVFRTFPNPDRTIREWIQIRTREGRPQEKVVALPVKDPYHIARNLLLIIELLEKERRKTNE